MTIRELLKQDLACLSNVFHEEERVQLRAWHIDDLRTALKQNGWREAGTVSEGNFGLLFRKKVGEQTADVVVDSDRGGADPYVVPATGRTITDDWDQPEEADGWEFDNDDDQ